MEKQNVKPVQTKSIPLKKRGRPTIYTQELADKICLKVATNPDGLKKLCNLNPDFPNPDTVREWRLNNHAFSVQYAAAKYAQADLLAEDCLDISDDDHNDTRVDQSGNESCNSEFIARSRLRVDTRKWLASKLLPKQYGGDALLQMARDENIELREEVKALRNKLDEKNRKDY